MSWWGKLLGGTFGFMLGGPLGALIGAALGHNFDAGLSKTASQTYQAGSQERIQTAFFTATFSVMGHLAKADGRVSEAEIGLARHIMAQMQLTQEQIQTARELFKQGKQTDFPLHAVIDQFRTECRRRHTLVQMFLEIQMHAAYADGVMHPNEKKLLLTIFERLGFSEAEYHHLEHLVRAQHFSGDTAAKHGAASIDLLTEAYGILDVSENSSNEEIKRAYRRLMSQHHPDKLVAKGLPEEMMKLATEKTHEIRKAYELIQKSRNF